MKILVDVGHPSHVHFYRNAIAELKNRGHEVLVTARDKEVVFQLLKAYGIPYLNRGGAKAGLLRKAVAMVEIDVAILKTALRFRPDVLTGEHNPYIAQASMLLGKPSAIFADTEHARIASMLTFPFASRIYTPMWFKKSLGRKQLRYNGFKEQAYLHPKYFKPNDAVLERLGLEKTDRYAVLRLVSWNAAHDRSQQGITNVRGLIELLEREFRVFISSESSLPEDLGKYRASIPPEELHDLLYHAGLHVGEGATTATEAGLLGTPSVYISTLAGTMGNFDELARYGLAYSYRTITEAEGKIQELLDVKAKENWRSLRERVMEDKIDVTKFMVEQIESQNERP